MADSKHLIEQATELATWNRLEAARLRSEAGQLRPRALSPLKTRLKERAAKHTAVAKLLEKNARAV